MATYYVDGTRPDDTGAGTSEATAKQTLSAGVALATAAGDVVNIKDSATYTLTAAVAPAVAGVTLRGYHATPGDRGGRPAITSATNSVDLVNVSASGLLFDHLAFSHTAGTRGRGLVAKGGVRNDVWVHDCTFDGLKYAIDGEYSVDYSFAGLAVSACGFTNGTADAIVNGGGTAAIGCTFKANAAAGWRYGSYPGAAGGPALTASRCVFANNARGIHFDGSSVCRLVLDRSTFRGQSVDGVTEVVTSSTTHQLWMFANIFYGNTGYALNFGLAPRLYVARANAYGSNTSGNRNNVPAGEGDLTLTADPFTNAGSGDFTLNNTAGGGALLRGAGWPATLTGLAGTSYPDIGAYQSGTSAGGIRPVYFNGGV